MFGTTAREPWPSPRETGERTFFDDTLPGFGIRVSPSSKTFVLVIHRHGRNKWETLGRYPTVSLAKAREEARNRLSAVQLRKGPEIPELTFPGSLRRVPHLLSGQEQAEDRL